MPARFKWKAAQYFEALWWRGYLRRKDLLAYKIWKQNYWHGFLKILAKDVSLDSKGEYLDLGCGPAGVFMALPGRVTAIDPLVEKYRQDFPLFFNGLPGEVSFYGVKAEDFESEKPYDIVFCLNVINHVDDIAKAMQNLQHLCKSGGLLVISVDEHRWKTLHRVFRRLPLDILHPYQLCREEFQSMLIFNGFETKCTIVMKEGWIFRYRVWVATKSRNYING
jgi:2-polyprenyl-6-hydroxyphenyl methylase/3-demethylubiquinone-9 3-methyltransferase